MSSDDPWDLLARRIPDDRRARSAKWGRDAADRLLEQLKDDYASRARTGEGIHPALALRAAADRLDDELRRLAGGDQA